MVVPTQRDKEQLSVKSRRALLDRELQRWLPLLIAYEQPERIIVFGSYGTDQVSEWSDVDLVVVKETELRFLDRTRRMSNS